MRWASVPPIWPEPIKAILSRAMGNPSFERTEVEDRKFDWLVIPFDRPVQVGACSIVGPASISINHNIRHFGARQRLARKRGPVGSILE
jgi:hypothetical protein